MQAQNILQLKGITKIYPSVVANDSISISVKKGEVHAILGENGAGKTTLMNILYGICRPDKGEIWSCDIPVKIGSSKDAIGLGIGMVHQHFMLINALTVMENIALSLGKNKKGILIDEKGIEKKVKELSDKYGLKIDLYAKIEDISVGQQQRVEIIKALYQDCKVMILDEPTAVLTPLETKELMRAINLFKSQNKSVIFISHKLKEVMEISDTITVLREGKVVGTVDKNETNSDELVAMMVGRKIAPMETEFDRVVGDIVLDVENISVTDKSKVERVKNLSMKVRAGEIYGIAGVDGNGQMELIKAVAGIIGKSKGKVTILGKDVTKVTPKDILDSGVSHIPEDRQTEGLVMDLPIKENLILNNYDSEELKGNRLFLSWKKIKEYSDKLISSYQIKTPDAELEAQFLSGGNQQKLIVARALANNPKLLLAVHPTRGVDIGAVEFIHSKFLEARDNGCGVLLVSTDLDEILALSDTIGVIYEGEIFAEMKRKDTNIDIIGKAMAGQRIT